MTDEKDRRTRMIHSSVNAPEKKGGAGAYNWGGALEASGEQVLHGPSAGAGPNVVVTSGPNIAADAGSPSGQGSSLNLTVQGPRAVWTVAGAPTSPTSQTQPVTSGTYRVVRSDFPQLVPGSPEVWSGPQLVLAPDQHIRAGAAELFDPQHPRHLFAKKAYHAPAAPTGIAVANGGPEPNAAGADVDPAASTVVVSSGAHLSKYVTAPEATPMSRQQLEALTGPNRLEKLPRRSCGSGPWRRTRTGLRATSQFNLHVVK